MFSGQRRRGEGRNVGEHPGHLRAEDADSHGHRAAHPGLQAFSRWKRSLASVQKTASAQRAAPGQLWGLGAQRTLGGCADGWPGEAVPCLRLLIRRGAGGRRDVRSPPVTPSPAPHLGRLSGSLGILSLALPLLCWSPHCRARRILQGAGEVSDARLREFPMVGVGQPCGCSGCPESAPAKTCCPSHLAHDWSQEELICGETDLGAA